MVGNILIVDGVATNRIVFKVALEQAFYQPVLIADGESCLHLARDICPDLIMLDLTLPDQSGVSLIAQLRADPATREIPVLAFAGQDDADDRLRAFRAGADDVLDKPVNPQLLLARVRNLLRGRDGADGVMAGDAAAAMIGCAETAEPYFGPAVISLLMTDGRSAQQQQATLAPLMTHKITVQSRHEAFSDSRSTVRKDAADVFLIGGNGDRLRLLSELKSRHTTRHSAICLINTQATAEAAAIAFDMGADDVVNDGVSPDEMAVRLQTLIRRKRRDDLRRASVQDGLKLAVIDPLTGLHNRRYAMPSLAAIAERSAADAALFAVMVIDLDRFKSVNDRFGHAAGDAVLVEVAQRLRANLRAGDLLARMGGEEFLVALPNTNFDDACRAAERLCHAIEEKTVSLGGTAAVGVTVSIGLAVSCGRLAAETIATIVDRADRALLAAKAEGRNKVIISRSAA